MKKTLRQLFTVIPMVVSSLLLHGQDTPDMEQGMKPFRSYQGGNIDTVALANGNLMIDKEIASVPQRADQLHVGYRLRYNGKNFFVNTYCDPTTLGCYNYWDVRQGLPWAFGNPGIQILNSLAVDEQLNYQVVGIDGNGSIIYQYSNTIVENDGASYDTPFSQPSAWPPMRIGEGSNIFLVPGSGAPDAGGFYDSHGVWHLPSRLASYPQGVIAQDTNGNQISVVFNSSGHLDHLLDTMGRAVPFGLSTTTTDFSGCTGPLSINSAYVLSLPGINGGTQNFKFCYAAPLLQTNFSGGLGDQFQQNVLLLQSLVLPDGTAWTFEYNSRDAGDPSNINYGDLTKISFPTGGTLSYTWATVIFQILSSDGHTNIPQAPSRSVVSRTLNANDGTGDHTWHYSYDTSSGRQIVTTVTDPLGNRTVHTFTPAQPYTVPSLETQTQYFDNANNLLKKEVTQWGSGTSCTVCERPTQITTSLANGQVSQVTKGYIPLPAMGSFNSIDPGILSDEYVYDYGPAAAGPLLRHDHTDYLFQSNLTYLNFNVLDRISNQITSDSAGNQFADTYYGFDQSPLASSGVTTAHTSPFNGTYRGNRTSVNRWLNGSVYLTTSSQFNDTGTVAQTSDPLGHTTTHSYDAFYVGAYPTQTCSPATNGGAVAHCVSATYDFNTGLVTSFTNENATSQASGNTPGDSAHTSTYAYDSMLRLTSGQAPPDTANNNARATTSFTYSAPDVFPVTVTRTKSITNTLTDSATSFFDGLGRPYRTQHAIPAGNATVDASFDALGRVATVSNPYFATTDSTYGITQTQYDALGRVTQVTKQDGSISTVSYNGNCMTATDEAGKQRKSCSDALGRLTNVWEDPLGLNYETDYHYDTIGNLLRVDQKGSALSDGSQWRTRLFTYDSLKRLLTAYNPESNTGLTGNPPAPIPVNTTYTYDANGNLLQKTSPAPNQIGLGTQTLSYCYDALNRVTGRAYSPQTCTNGQLPAGTAVVSYTYDQGTNGIGHMTHVNDQAGSGDYTYDNLGRIATETRTISGFSKNMSYEYNLDGSVFKLHNPSGAVLTYTYDSAGRVGMLQDLGNNINYASGPGGPPSLATYGPDGSLTGFVSGKTSSFAGITNSFSFNKRLQPVFVSASSPSQTAFSIGYDFHVGNGTAGSGSDNGNVYALTNNKDHTRDQTFTYDQLNRLISAQNAGTDCSITLPDTNSKFWGNSYNYDAWGNLLAKNVTKCGAEFLSVVAQANNRLVGFGYDAAGNMNSAPIPTGGQATSIFDAENRMTTSSLGGTTTTYSYDGDGNRVKKSNGSTGTLYWYMTLGVVAESDLAGNLQSEYVFFDGERVARKDFPSNAVSYYFSDHLKTASVITDSAGNIKSESDYYPWGGELQFLANDSNHYKFTGKERDNETGLDYFGARYYSNALGRFISADWSATPEPVPYADLSDPQSLNLYTYVRNIPTTRIDATGHDDSFLAALKAWWNETAASFSRVHSSKDGSQAMEQSNPAIGPSAEQMVQYTNDKVGTGIDNMAAVLTAFDPTGASGALRSHLKGDNLGVGLAMAGPFIGLAGGEVANAARAFGFKSFATAANIVGGELEGGGSALVGFSRSGSELGVTVSAVHGPAGLLGD